jgi:hypothetical protein
MCPLAPELVLSKTQSVCHLELKKFFSGGAKARIPEHEVARLKADVSVERLAEARDALAACWYYA